MAKAKQDEELKSYCFIIHRNQVDIFIKKYFPVFSQDLCNVIQDILKNCFQWEADIVMLFLNNHQGNYSCTCFMPIYNDEAVLNQNIGAIKDIRKSAALPPYYLRTIYNLPEGDIFSISDIAFKIGGWQKEYSFGVLNEEGEDDEMYRLNTIPFSDVRIKKETLELEESQLEIYKRLADEHPKNKKILWFRNMLVRQITDHKRALELENGFTKLQYDAYDYTLRMPNVIDGKFDAVRFEPFIEFVDDFFKKVHASLQHMFCLNIAAAGAGSAVLFIDIVPQKLEPSQQKSWDEGKEHLKKTVEALPELTKQGDANVRVNDFCEKASLDPPQANELLKKVSKIFPASVDKEGVVEIYSRTPEKPAIKFDQEGSDYFLKAKKNLSDSLKPVEEEIISGFLGLIVGWESEEPRFIIETEEKRRITVRYDKERTEEVRSRFKKNVKLERIKDGRSWRLVNWK